MQYKQKLVLGLLLAISLLQGCASTEALYAEYEHQCRVSVISNASGTVVVENDGAGSMLWEPAVYFNYDKDDLTDKEKLRLDADMFVLNKYPELNINVRGFTDSIATQKYNIDLAARRVDTVITYLQSKGLDKLRIQRAPLGESLPLADNDSYEHRAINRRVELLLLDQTGRAAPVRMFDKDGEWASPANLSAPGTEKDWRR